MPKIERLPYTDMPQLFQAADSASITGQKQYLHGTRARLVLVSAAALSGIASWRVGRGEVDVLALAAVVLFVAALLVECALWKSRPDKAWYDARAVAESAKTLTWKFAVCAEPFPNSLAAADAVKVLIDRLGNVGAQYPHLRLAPVDAQMVTEWMSVQRSAPWSERRQVYLDARLRDQKAWYTQKAQYNTSRSNQWRVALVGLEFVGFVMSLLQALKPGMPALSGFVAAVVGAVVAWVETKQHDFNARAYSAAVSDLTKAEARLINVEEEAGWAREVNDAEDAISREHTLWLASRSR